MVFPGHLALKGNILRELEELASRPAEEIGVLQQRLADYVEAARQKLAEGTVQRKLAEGIAANSLELLLAEQDGPYRHLAQAAILYLLQTEDLISDFDSPYGLYDDVEVFNAVAHALMRPDLTVIEG